MRKIFKKIINSFIYFSQKILMSIFNVYSLIFISNYGFKAKSKILVKYLLHAVKFKNRSNKVFAKNYNKISPQNQKKKLF